MPSKLGTVGVGDHDKATVKGRGGTASRGTRRDTVIRCLTLRRQVLTTARRRTPLSLKSSTFFLPFQKNKKNKKNRSCFPGQSGNLVQKIFETISLCQRNKTCLRHEKQTFEKCNAGRRKMLRPKIERYCLESFFLERNFWSSITGRTTLFPSMSMEWIHSPRIRTFVQKRFHGLFFKKKRWNSGVFLRFQEENTFGQ